MYVYTYIYIYIYIYYKLAKDIEIFPKKKKKPQCGHQRFKSLSEDEK